MGSRYRETEIRTASPEKLVVLLYEGALRQARRARESHLAERVGDRGAAISRALAIVAELQQSLDVEAGGDIARNLRALYFFVTDRLLEANVTNRVGAIDEAIEVLETLYEAWAEIAAKGLGSEAATG